MSTGRQIVPRIEVDESGLGPCMLQLTPPKRAYVIARVFEGLNKSRAAEVAGYSNSSPEVLASAAYRLEHDEAVQSAMAEECRKLMRSEGAASIRALVEARDDPLAKAADRVKAATAILDRCGLGALSQHMHVVDHTVTYQSSSSSTASLISEIAALLNLSEDRARRLIFPRPGAAIDAEFEEIVSDDATADKPTTAERERARQHESERRREMAALTPEEKAERKRLYREQMRAQAKARYAAARNDIAVAVNRGVEMDVTAAVADAEAQYALTQAALDADDDLADLLGETTDD